MKILITNYTFDASEKTITFGDYGSIVLDSVLLITNVTDNIIIYNFANPSLGGSVATNVLTLDYDTTSMSDTDDLQIFYEDTAQDFINDSTNGTLVNLGSNNDVTVAGVATAAKQDTIIGHLDGVESTLTTIDGRVDGIEGLLTTIDADTGNISTKVDTLAGAVSGSEMQVDVVTSALPTGAATSAKQDTIIGHLDGVETLLTAIDGHVDGLETSNSAIQTSVELIDDAIKTDDAAFTPATTKVMMAGFEFDDSSPDSVDEGDAGAARMSSRREVYTQIRDAAGNERGANVNASGQLAIAGPVTNAGTFAVQVDGSALTALQLIDDTVATLGTTTYTEASTKGNIIGAVRRDANTSLVDTTNEVAPLQVNATGELKVAQIQALPAGTNAIGKLAANTGVDIGDVDVTSIVPGTGATNLGKAEDAGHSSGDVGVMMLGVRQDSGGGFGADGDYVPFGFNSLGAAYVTDVDTQSYLENIAGAVKSEDAAHSTGHSGVFALGVRNDTPNTATTNTDGDYAQISVNKLGSIRTALLEDDFAVAGSNHVKKYYTNAGAVTDGIVWSPAVGKRWYVTDLIINTSAAATVTLEDDKAGGDEVVMKFELAANSGVTHHFGTPLFSGEDAADLLVTTSAGNIYITITGYEI